MGEININQAEVTLLSLGKKRVKRLNGDYADAIQLAKVCRVMLSDGTEYFADIRIIPQGIYADAADADGFVYENFFIEGYDVSDGKGNIVHERRSNI